MIIYARLATLLKYPIARINHRSRVIGRIFKTVFVPHKSANVFIQNMYGKLHHLLIARKSSFQLRYETEERRSLDY